MFLKPHFGVETLSWVCILGAAPFAALGFIKYNGMTAEKALIAFIKSEFLIPKHLTFKAQNIYAEAFEDVIDRNLKKGMIRPQNKFKERKNKKKKKNKSKNVEKEKDTNVIDDLYKEKIEKEGNFDENAK